MALGRVPPPAKPTMALGRVPTPAGTPASPPKTMCEMAASARARNSPAAPALAQRCNAELAAKPAAAVPLAAPASAPSESSSPVQKPQDLLIGRITYSLDGQNVGRLQVGKPVTIVCTYIVNEVVGPFVFRIQPWQGNIQIGGKATQTFVFRGDPQGGQHEARQIWTPSDPGKTPVSCVLNPGFENSEADPSNNRSNEFVIVEGPPDPSQ